MHMQERLTVSILTHHIMENKKIGNIIMIMLGKRININTVNGLRLWSVG